MIGTSRSKSGTIIMSSSEAAASDKNEERMIVKVVLKAINSPVDILKMSPFLEAMIAEPGVGPENNCRTEHREDLIEYVGCVRQPAGRKGGTFLFREFAGPFAEGSIFGAGDAKLVHAINQLENESGNGTSNVEKLPLMLHLQEIERGGKNDG